MSHPSHAGDLQLVERVVAGEAAAWMELEARAGRIVTACLRRAQARWGSLAEDHEDLQQSFRLKLLEDDHRVLRDYSGRAALSTFLHTVASRHFHRELARRAKEAQRHADDPESALDRAPSDAPAPDQHTLSSERAQRVREVLDGLKSDDRALIALLVEQDAPAHTVAATLGITPDGVRMRKMRLLRKLARRLQGLWP